MNEITHWNTQRSRNLYGIENWGAGYFDINNDGNISVTPDGPEGEKIDLFKLVESVQERDIELPILFRFNGILRHRVRTLYNAFQSAINEFNYQGTYRPCYPIKVKIKNDLLKWINNGSGIDL